MIIVFLLHFNVISIGDYKSGESVIVTGSDAQGFN